MQLPTQLPTRLPTRLNTIEDYYLATGGGGRGKFALDQIREPSAAAFSVFLLTRRAADLPIMQVRRDTDNDEVQVLADLSLAEPRIILDSPLVGSASTFGDFLGSASGFVFRWFDQSGNARHASQETTGNQGRIANAGVLDDGIRCATTQVPVLAVPAGTIPTNLFATSGRQWTLSEVSRPDSSPSTGLVAGVFAPGSPGTQNLYVAYASQANRRPRIQIRLSDNALTTADLNQWNTSATRWNGTNASTKVNQSAMQPLAVGTSTEVTQPFVLGSFYDGLIGEAIVWATALSEDQLSSLQNNQYSRFPIP
jgi:hypothetical protein